MLLKELRKVFLLLIISVSLFVTGCREVNCDDADKSFEYWAGQKPPKDIKIINGQYWQSPHFTLEYILFLKLKPTRLWWEEFIKQNGYVEDTDEFVIPDDAPKWFAPSEHSKVWKPLDDFQGSRLYKDSISGNYYIYLIQL